MRGDFEYGIPGKHIIISKSSTGANNRQRNFRKVMRSALSQVKGRIPEDFGEQQQRRREVLSLYRWTGDGTGLAL